MGAKIGETTTTLSLANLAAHNHIVPPVTFHPLGIDEKDRCCGIFYIGYPKGEWPKSYRKPLPELVEYVK